MPDLTISLGVRSALLMVISTKVFESANILAIWTLCSSEVARQSAMIDLDVFFVIAYYLLTPIGVFYI